MVKEVRHLYGQTKYNFDVWKFVGCLLLILFPGQTLQAQTVFSDLILTEDGKRVYTTIRLKNNPPKIDRRIGKWDDIDGVCFDSYFNFQQFRSNLVARWEYKPGSALFLVWTHGRSDYEKTNENSLSHGFSRMFEIASQNVFLLKFNYWFEI